MDFDAVCASGDLAPIREWLRTNICTGAAPRTPTSSCSPRAESPSRLRYYTDYLTQKFSSLYGLQ